MGNSNSAARQSATGGNPDERSSSYRPSAAVAPEGSRFPRRRCSRMQQSTVVCHVIVVTVDFQATFEDVLVCDLVLMALPFLFLSLSTELVVVFCVCYVSL